MGNKTLEVFNKLLTLQTKSSLGVDVKISPYCKESLSIAIYKDKTVQSDLLFEDSMIYGRDEEYIISVLNDLIKEHVKQL